MGEDQLERAEDEYCPRLQIPSFRFLKRPEEEIEDGALPYLVTVRTRYADAGKRKHSPAGAEYEGDDIETLCQRVVADLPVDYNARSLEELERVLGGWPSHAITFSATQNTITFDERQEFVDSLLAALDA